MGQCFSISQPLQPEFATGYQSTWIPEPAAPQRQSPSEKDTPHRPARPAFTGVDHGVAVPPPRQFVNRFIDRLREEKAIFPPGQQDAIDRLSLCDSRKHSGITNAKLLPHLAAVYEADPDVRTAGRRRESFLLIQDVLRDVLHEVCDVHVQDSEQSFLTRSLITAQTEALLHQIEIGKDEIRQKIMQRRRLCPLLTHETHFNRFLEDNASTIRSIKQACRMGGNARRQMLRTNLQSLGINYLAKAQRLPHGLKSGIQLEHNGAKYENVKFLVFLERELERSPILHNLEGSSVGVVAIVEGDCTHPDVDPANGSQEDRYYALGLEHLPIHEKQAAIYIQKLMVDLGDLELQVAEARDPQSMTIDDATLTSVSQLDREYRGSSRMGDRLDEMGTDPDNQRVDLVTALSKLKVLADLFPDRQPGNELLLDPALLAWVKSGQFQTEIGGLRYPEINAFILSTVCVKNALLASGQFGFGEDKR